MGGRWSLPTGDALARSQLARNLKFRLISNSQLTFWVLHTVFHNLFFPQPTPLMLMRVLYFQLFLRGRWNLDKKAIFLHPFALLSSLPSYLPFFFSSFPCWTLHELMFEYWIFFNSKRETCVANITFNWSESTEKSPMSSINMDGGRWIII